MNNVKTDILRKKPETEIPGHLVMGGRGKAEGWEGTKGSRLRLEEDRDTRSQSELTLNITTRRIKETQHEIPRVDRNMVEEQGENQGENW